MFAQTQARGSQSNGSRNDDKSGDPLNDSSQHYYMILTVMNNNTYSHDSADSADENKLTSCEQYIQLIIVVSGDPATCD